MARSALQALDTLELLGVDSLLFISDNADGHPDSHAGDGRSNGLDQAGGQAEDHAGFGLETAATAPAEVGPDVPGGPPSLTGPSDIIAIDVVAAGKGGSKGPNGGTDTGGTGDTGGGDTVTARFISGDPDSGTVDNYNIQIDFYGDLWLVTDNSGNLLYDLGEAFVAAAQFLSDVIAEGANDVYDILGNLAYDDLVIDAKLTSFSDPNILGQAGPTGVRTSDGLTATGLMEFSIDWAAQLASDGHWDEVVLHEMMHVLGVGTLWDYNNLLQTTNYLIDDNGTKKPTDDIYESVITYTGTSATTEYGDTLYVEDDGGSGTAGGHWNESQDSFDLADGTTITAEGYGAELMTGYLGTASSDYTYLEYFTIASLADIGYTLVSGYKDVVDGIQTVDETTGITLVSTDGGYDDHLLA